MLRSLVGSEMCIRDRSSICQKVRLTSGVLRRMQLTLHATRRTPHGGASRVVLAMSAWSVKTRRAPSRHCRVVRVYGRMTTAMHDLRTPPPGVWRSTFLHTGLGVGSCVHCQKTTWYVLWVHMSFHLHVTRRTPHGALRLVQAVSAWSVKPRRAPSRHCRDARVYGHTTTPIYGCLLYTSPSPRDS